MKLLVVSPLLYYAGCGNGGGLICFRLLEGLAARHEIALLAFSALDAAEEAQARLELAPLCADLRILPLPAGTAGTRLRGRAGQWLGGPPADAAGFDVPSMHETVQAAVRAFAPDVALLQFPYMAQYVADLPNVPTIMDVQDVFFVSRLREYAAQKAAWPRAKRWVSWQAWTRYELAWYPRCQALMAISEPDRAALQILVPDVESFSNPAAISARDIAALPPARPGRVGFGGNFGHPPNLDALAFLNTEIAPRLAGLFPAVEIVVAGRGIPASARANLHSTVRLQGFVSDYDAFVASCSVFIAPLRFGGGVKIKVLEALACGRPVVTTPIGAEGIPLGPDEGLQVAQHADELARLTAAALMNPAPRAAAAARGAAHVVLQFGASGAVQRFEDAASRVLEAHRVRAPRAGPGEPLAAAESRPA